MGNNYVKQLGIKPEKEIGTRDFKGLWTKYAEREDKYAKISRRNALKFLKDFAEAVKVKYEPEVAKALIMECDPTSSGWLDKNQFASLFFASTGPLSSPRAGKKTTHKLKLTASLAEEVKRFQDEGDVADSSAHTEEKRSNEKSKKYSNNSHEHAPTEHDSDADRKSSQDSPAKVKVSPPLNPSHMTAETKTALPNPNAQITSVSPTFQTTIVHPLGSALQNQSSKESSAGRRKGERLTASRTKKSQKKTNGGNKQGVNAEDLPDARSDLTSSGEEEDTTIDINTINVDEEEEDTDDEVILYTDSTAADAPSDLSLSHLFPVTST